MSPWQRLGIEPGSDLKTVKQAYAQAIKRHKPDEDPAAFAALNAAYKQLCKQLKSAPPTAAHDNGQFQQRDFTQLSVTVKPSAPANISFTDTTSWQAENENNTRATTVAAVEYEPEQPLSPTVVAPLAQNETEPPQATVVETVTEPEERPAVAATIAYQQLDEQTAPPYYQPRQFSDEEVQLLQQQLQQALQQHAQSGDNTTEFKQLLRRLTQLTMAQQQSINRSLLQYLSDDIQQDDKSALFSSALLHPLLVHFQWIEHPEVAEQYLELAQADYLMAALRNYRHKYNNVLLPFQAELKKQLAAREWQDTPQQQHERQQQRQWLKSLRCPLRSRFITYFGDLILIIAVHSSYSMALGIDQETYPYLIFVFASLYFACCDWLLGGSLCKRVDGQMVVDYQGNPPHEFKLILRALLSSMVLLNPLLLMLHALFWLFGTTLQDVFSRTTVVWKKKLAAEPFAKS